MDGYDYNMHMQMVQGIMPDVGWDRLTQLLPPGPAAPSATPGTPVVKGHNTRATPIVQRPSTNTSQERPREKETQSATAEDLGMQRSLHDRLVNEGVSRDTIQRLVNNGFVTQTLLSVIETEDIKVMGIQPLAQQRLLNTILQKEKGVAEAPTTTARPAQQGTTDVMASINSQVGMLLRDLPQTSSGQSHGQDRGDKPTNMAGDRISLDPLTYLLPPATTKFLEITNFIQFEDCEEEQELWENGTNKVVLKATSKKVKLENVTPMQWSAANIRILFELIREGKLKTGHIWDYLAYTVKISEMTSIYTWGSVLRYDHAYRRAQAAVGFRWASDSPYVDKMNLRFREEKTTQKGKEKNKSQVTKKPCAAYQTDNCKFGEKCWHKHVCDIKGCEENHPRSQHGQGN